MDSGWISEKKSLYQGTSSSKGSTYEIMDLDLWQYFSLGIGGLGGLQKDSTLHQGTSWSERGVPFNHRGVRCQSYLPLVSPELSPVSREVTHALRSKGGNQEWWKMSFNYCDRVGECTWRSEEWVGRMQAWLNLVTLVETRFKLSFSYQSLKFNFLILRFSFQSQFLARMLIDGRMHIRVARAQEV